MRRSKLSALIAALAVVALVSVVVVRVITRSAEPAAVAGTVPVRVTIDLPVEGSPYSLSLGSNSAVGSAGATVTVDGNDRASGLIVAQDRRGLIRGLAVVTKAPYLRTSSVKLGDHTTAAAFTLMTPGLLTGEASVDVLIMKAVLGGPEITPAAAAVADAFGRDPAWIGATAQPAVTSAQDVLLATTIKRLRATTSRLSNQARSTTPTTAPTASPRVTATAAADPAQPRIQLAAFATQIKAGLSSPCSAERAATSE